MVKLLSILVIISHFSCTSITNKSTEDVFLGTWQLNVINGTYFNVCPIFEFSKEYKGSIIKPSKEKIDFKYHIDNNKLFFLFNEKKNFFGNDSEFYYRNYEEGGALFMELISVDSSKFCLLSREKR